MMQPLLSIRQTILHSFDEIFNPGLFFFFNPESLWGKKKKKNAIISVMPWYQGINGSYTKNEHDGKLLGI